MCGKVLFSCNFAGNTRWDRQFKHVVTLSYSITGFLDFLFFFLFLDTGGRRHLGKSRCTVSSNSCKATATTQLLYDQHFLPSPIQPQQEVGSRKVSLICLCCRALYAYSHHPHSYAKLEQNAVFLSPKFLQESYHPILWLCLDIPHAALPRAQLSRAALLSPSRLTQMESFSFWFCSLAPSAPKMKASPLELPAMRPVRGVDKVSIKFFQQPIKMYRAKAIPRKNINTITTGKWHNRSSNGKKPSHICPLHAELPIHMYNVLIYFLFKLLFDPIYLHMLLVRNNLLLVDTLVLIILSQYLQQQNHLSSCFGKEETELKQMPSVGPQSHCCPSRRCLPEH